MDGLALQDAVGPPVRTVPDVPVDPLTEMEPVKDGLAKVFKLRKTELATY